MKTTHFGSTVRERKGKKLKINKSNFMTLIGRYIAVYHSHGDPDVVACAHYMFGGSRCVGTAAKHIVPF